MKRSAINEILGHTRQFFSLHDVHLPLSPVSRRPNGASLIPPPGEKFSTLSSVGMSPRLAATISPRKG